MEQKKSEFNKVLNAWDVLVIAFGAMIGWGWVVSTGGWIEKGGVLGAAIGFVIGGIMIFFVGMTYAELTAAMPQCGGEHVFSYKAMGSTGSFICTWMIILGYVSVACFETVVLLSHKKADSYIHIDVEFGEGEGKIPVDSIAKRAEAYKPKEKVTYKMIKEYIEAKYGFKVHTAYIAEVKRNLGLPMYDAPNAVEELKQPRKHPTPEKVEAIKDALRYFAVI